jgi:hypothetical protein
MHHRHQRGYVALVVAIVLLVLASFFLLNAVNSGLQTLSTRHAEAVRLLQRIQSALVEYARLNKRLPCPADPAADTGLPVPNAPTVPPATCVHPGGTVPWAVLQMTGTDALDPWARKISYRVTSGSAGATVAGGLDRSQCDVLNAIPPVNPDDYFVDSTTGLCKQLVPPATKPRTLLSNVIAVPSLALTDNGTGVSGVAYALISHGESGRGAYLIGGQRVLPMPSAGSSELTNTGTLSVVRATPNTTVPADQPAFFDDIVRYETLANLITRAGLQARDWPD